jgi:hypothetical protein
LRIFEFTDQIYAGLIPKIGWWNIENSTSVEQNEFDFGVAVGFPSFNNGINYETLNMNLAPRAIFGTSVGHTFGKLCGLKMENALDYNPRGLSGSPIFGLVQSANGFTAKLAGVLSNAGPKQLNYWPISSLVRLVNYALTRGS